jgi:hypothetical protein
MRPFDNTDWTSLERNCHREEAQDAIGFAIREGMIRVIPAPNGGIRIIPLAGSPVNPIDAIVPRANSTVYPMIEAPPRRLRTTFPPIRRAPGTAVSSPRR